MYVNALILWTRTHTLEMQLVLSVLWFSVVGQPTHRPALVVMRIVARLPGRSYTWTVLKFQVGIEIQNGLCAGFVEVQPM